MKMIKKLIVALLVAFSLCACGSDMSGSKYVGTWSATSCEYEGLSMPVESIYGTFTIELTEKGKAIITTADDEGTGSWKETETGIDIDNGDIILDENEEGELVLEQDGVTVLFEKG